MVVICDLAKTDLSTSKISTNSVIQSTLLRIDSHSSKQMQNASKNHSPVWPGFWRAPGRENLTKALARRISMGVRRNPVEFNAANNPIKPK